jgi:hypothetical protein
MIGDDVTTHNKFNYMTILFVNEEYLYISLLVFVCRHLAEITERFIVAKGPLLNCGEKAATVVLQ